MSRWYVKPGGTKIMTPNRCDMAVFPYYIKSSKIALAENLQPYILEKKFPSLHCNFCLIPVMFCGLCHMFYRRFLKPFSNLKIFFQNSNFFGLWGPFLRFFWKLKILSFFENFHSGHVAHVLYPIFEAIFDFENIFSKFSFFWPLGPIFWKNSKFWVFL